MMKMKKLSTEPGVSLRFGAGGYLDLAPGQSLGKAFKILKIYSFIDAESSRAKPSLQPIKLSSAWPLMKPLQSPDDLHLGGSRYYGW